MGIRSLNSYLRDKCPDSIRCINMADLSGKKIAIDISIYLYRYETENALLENIYLMLSIFRHYNIIPIFIFDGKPPPEKQELLFKRKESREDAQDEYVILQNKLETCDYDSCEKQTILDTMEQLKKQFVQINREKIFKAKELITAYGATYYDAPGEADELCASLVIRKKVWACLSEDMDLFVYGCTRVLRYFSLINHTAVLYYTKGILEELKLSQLEFRQICVLSGTDYNINANGNNDNIRLIQSMKHFRKYQNFENTHLFGFYEWLIEYTDVNPDVELLNKIVNMFSLDNVRDKNKLQAIDKIRIVNGIIDQDKLKEIMAEEDFIFCK
jgi:flap endonuclease-1